MQPNEAVRPTATRCARSGRPNAGDGQIRPLIQPALRPGHAGSRTAGLGCRPGRRMPGLRRSGFRHWCLCAADRLLAAIGRAAGAACPGCAGACAVEPSAAREGGAPQRPREPGRHRSATPPPGWPPGPDPRWACGRVLRRRAGRDADRPVQDRGDPPAGVAGPRGRRTARRSGPPQPQARSQRAASGAK